MIELIDIRHADLVVAPAEGEAPALPGHLILQIVAGLAQLVLLAAVHGDVIRLRAVDRIKGVDSRECAIVAGGVVAAVLIVDPHQQAMVDGPGIDAAVELVIKGDGVHLFVRAGIAAVQLAFVQPARGIHLIQLNFGMQVAQLLPHRPAVIKHMLEVVADHIFAAIVLVVIIFAFEEGIRDFLAVVRHHGAFIGEARVAAALRIAM